LLFGVGDFVSPVASILYCSGSNESEVADPWLVHGKLEGIGHDAVVAGPGVIGIVLAVVMGGGGEVLKSRVRNVDLDGPCAEVFVCFKAYTLDRMETVESAPSANPESSLYSPELSSTSV